MAFFAASRRGMHALLTGDLDAARAALTDARAAGRAAGVGRRRGHRAHAAVRASRGRRATPRRWPRRPASWEGYGLAEGIRSITAWAAVLWAAAGEPDRARAVLHQLGDFAAIPRDVDWLLTVYLLTEVAAAVGERAQAEVGLDLLTPYAGRGVIDAGGVAFVGVVDAVLARAGAAARPARRRRPVVGERQAAYRRIGATWLLHTPASAPARHSGAAGRGSLDASGPVRERPDAVGEPDSPPAPHSARAEPRVLHLRPGGDGIWWVGRDGGPSAVRDMRGLHYLHLLLSRPGLDVPALALSDAVAGNVAARAVDGDAGPLLDRQALAAYRRRLGELDDELAEARAHADLAREERLDRGARRAARPAAGRHRAGRAARVAGGTHERARVAVRKAIAAAIDRIAALDPSLGRLLGDTVTTGATCRYDPTPTGRSAGSSERATAPTRILPGRGRPARLARRRPGSAPTAATRRRLHEIRTPRWYSVAAASLRFRRRGTPRRARRRRPGRRRSPRARRSARTRAAPARRARP